MAQRGVQLDRETICCSICLDLLKDPVGLTCGHSYCMDCIKAHWDEEDQKSIYSCPQCRKIFIPKPVLEKNVVLAELVEELKKTGLQAAAADHCYAGAEDVACDVCTGRKMKAVKSCLVCLASYCQNLLQPHYDSPPLKKHQLMEPSKNLQENICSCHDKMMEMFCRTDQQLICYLCSVDEHRGHEAVSAAAEWMKKQKELEVSRRNVQQRIQNKEKDVKLLQQQLEDINVSADQRVEDSEKKFSEKIRLLQKRSSDVKQQIRSQQETEVSRVKELQEKLEQEITDLKKKDAEMKQLSDTEDHNQFLHNYPSVSALSESTHSSSINIRPQRHFEKVTAAVKDLRDQLQDILRDNWTNISLAVIGLIIIITIPFIYRCLSENSGTLDVLPSGPEPEPEPEPEPKTRADFLQYSRDITLDPDTAYRYLLLSEGNRKVTLMRQTQHHPDHPDRFTGWFQVLSKESLTGRCYWEVEWSGGGVEVAVTYKSISRKGISDESGFGLNDKSWSLRCDTNRYTFWYNNIETPVSGPRSSRVGVYVDHSAGVLSFYSVSGTMTLLHRVQTTFTEPLHVGVWPLEHETTVELIKLK